MRFPADALLIPQPHRQLLMTLFGVQLPEPVVQPEVHGLPSEQSTRSDHTGRMPPWTWLVSDGLRTFKVSLSSISFFISMFSLDKREQTPTRCLRFGGPPPNGLAVPDTRDHGPLESKRDKRAEISSRKVRKNR